MRQEAVLFRGTRDGLVMVLADQADWESIMRSLAEKLEASGGFFRGAEVTVLVGRRLLDEAERQRLAELTRRYGLVLRQIRAGEDADGMPGGARRPPTAGPHGRREERGAAPPPREAPPLVVVRTLRSGQVIRHPGDVIVVGDVNPGAEVIAAGHIVVLGALRGVAHAGAGGDDAAVVAAVRLEPTQLRIGQHVGRAPDVGQTPAGVPEVARVVDGRIVIEGRPAPGRYGPA